MNDKKKTKTKFWKNLSIFILIFFIIKLVAKFLKELGIKYKLSCVDDFKDEEEVELSEDDNLEDQE